jgi:hypothetical protein
LNRSAWLGWVAERRLVLALGVLAALPVLVAAGYALTNDWVPIGDDAYIGIRAYDVFTGRSPLVGQRSSGASGVLTETAYSPGPLLSGCSPSRCGCRTRRSCRSPPPRSTWRR